MNTLSIFGKSPYRILATLLLGLLFSVSMEGQDNTKAAWLSVTSFSYSGYNLEEQSLDYPDLSFWVHCKTEGLDYLIINEMEPQDYISPPMPFILVVEGLTTYIDSIRPDSFFVHIPPEELHECWWDCDIYLDLFYTGIGLTLRTDTLTLVDLIEDKETRLFLKNYETGIDAIETEKQSNHSDNAIFDLTGRQLFTKPKHGFYIQNGRKFFTK